MAKKYIGIGDSNLMKLWRKAVLSEWNNSCAFCGKYGDENLQCHHYVYRRVRLLRWDWKNGVALCNDCHQHAHTKQGDKKLYSLLEEKGFIEHLLHYENITLKDYCRINGISRNQFLLETKEDLLKKISDNDIIL
jgi:hypothetical protein